MGTSLAADAIAAAGCTLVFLPPYSPDYNPIENMWSKVKRRLRDLGARTVESLHDAIGSALATVNATDCKGFFRGCGYATQKGAQL